MRLRSGLTRTLERDAVIPFPLCRAFSVKNTGGRLGVDGDEVRTGSGSDRVTRETSLIKVRQFSALPIKHVLNCAGHTPLIPRVSHAALFRPRTVGVSPTIILQHLLGGVCLEGNESAFRLY